MTSKIVTANRLTDGRVVYLNTRGGWSEDVNSVNIARDEDQAAALLAQAQADAVANRVVEPYLIDVDENIGHEKGSDGDSGSPRLRRYRERIRASGPSVRLDHGKQAGWR